MVAKLQFFAFLAQAVIGRLSWQKGCARDRGRLYLTRHSQVEVAIRLTVQRIAKKRNFAVHETHGYRRFQVSRGNRENFSGAA